MEINGKTGPLAIRSMRTQRCTTTTGRHQFSRCVSLSAGRDSQLLLHSLGQCRVRYNRIHGRFSSELADEYHDSGQLRDFQMKMINVLTNQS